jgi:hypothetical protein
MLQFDLLLSILIGKYAKKKKNSSVFFPDQRLSIVSAMSANTFLSKCANTLFSYRGNTHFEVSFNYGTALKFTEC